MGRLTGLLVTRRATTVLIEAGWIHGPSHAGRPVCWVALAEGVNPIVRVSSWTVYGMDPGRPAREDFLLRPFREPYAVSKAKGDLVLQQMSAKRHLPAAITRPGAFFGSGDRLHFGRLADRLRATAHITLEPARSGSTSLPASASGSSPQKHPAGGYRAT